MNNNQPKPFQKYCKECNKERLPSSSNAKFEVDYCTNCKTITNFSDSKKENSLFKNIVKKTNDNK